MQLAKDRLYDRSLFERLHEVNHPCQLLDMQYRMHPEISVFPNAQFYSGVILDAPNVKDQTYSKPYQDLFGPYKFINASEGKEDEGKCGRSKRNHVEVQILWYLLERLQAGTLPLTFPFFVQHHLCLSPFSLFVVFSSVQSRTFIFKSLRHVTPVHVTRDCSQALS